MGEFPEAEARLFKNIYVCRKCEAKIRTTISKALAGKVVCRKCKSKSVRPIRARGKK